MLSKTSDIKLSFVKLPLDDPSGENPVMANFRDEELSLLDIFIREFLQNALDNRIELEDGHEAVYVNININKIEEPSNQSFIKNIFNQSALSYINSIEGINLETEPSIALILEENNTNGITGQKNNSNDNGNWSKFWHAQSSSSKTGSKNGRAGQGKISYHMISNAYTVFGLTNPKDSPDNLYLMGKCILPNNPEINDIAFKAHAFISEVEDESEQPIPFEDSETINAFSKAFSINRKPGDYGTSWVIPFPKGRGRGQPKENEIIESTIKGYFYSILTNKLTVKVGNILIDSNSIIELAEKYISKSESEFYSFIKQTSEADVVYRRQMLPQRWIEKTSIPEDILSQEKIDNLKSDYRKGKIISVKLPINIDTKNNGKKTSYFTVYLQSKENIEENKAAFVRSDLIISNESTYLLRQLGDFYALVVADDESVANFLAHCEIPNHTAFNHAMKAAVENYQSVKKTLTNIRMGAYRVYAFLDEVDSGSHPDALIDVLSVMGFKNPPPRPRTETNDDDDDDESNDSEGVDEPEMPEIFSDNKYFKIEDDGERIRILPGEEKFNQDQLPVGLLLEAGYESIDGGDPYKDHHHFDFDFTNSKSISISHEGVTNIESLAKPNKLELHIETVDFSLELSGFSLVERLRIRTTPFEVEE